MVFEVGHGHRAGGEGAVHLFEEVDQRRRLLDVAMEIDHQRVDHVHGDVDGFFEGTQGLSEDEGLRILLLNSE